MTIRSTSGASFPSPYAGIVLVIAIPIATCLRCWSMQATHRRTHPALLLGTALLLTLFLYYIDEGRYSLEGLFSAGNLIAMSIYLVGLVGGLFGAGWLLERLHPSPMRTALVLMLGAVLGLGLGLLLIIRLGALQHIG
jgi:hypothetical protein